MKKTIFILLSVIVLIVAGCANKKSDVAVSTDATETVIEATKDSTEKPPETEEPVIESETESVTEESDSEALKQENSNSNEKSDNQDTQSTQDVKPAQDAKSTSESEQTSSQTSEPEQTVEPEQPQQSSRVEYSPTNVVALATSKTKAAGKVLLTDNLDNLLASGQISQEEYNEYYPYDGAGYYSVFVDSNMAEARSVSGTTQFNSEDDIAQYIADMLVLENGPYFLIEYAGTYDYYGKTCYEFRCYRA